MSAHYADLLMNSARAVKLAQELGRVDANYALRGAGTAWHIYHMYPDGTPTRYLGLLEYTLNTTDAEPELPRD